MNARPKCEGLAPSNCGNANCPAHPIEHAWECPRCGRESVGFSTATAARESLDVHIDWHCPGRRYPCQHEWLDRPESDTRECLICGVEVVG